MPQNKNQHYIPQFYLRKFSLDGRSISIFNLNRPENVISKASIKGQCSKNYLYGKNEKLEKIIQNFEQEGCEIIRHIEKKLKIDEEQKFKILRYISFQYSRTPSSAEALSEFKDAMINEIVNIPGLHGTDEAAEIIKSNQKDFSDLLWENISIGAKTFSALIDLDFIVLNNCTKIEFVTSDVALWLHNIWTQDYKGAAGSLGYASKGLIIFFPLNPNLAILFYDSDIYNISRRKIKRKTIDLNLENDIKNLNNIFFEASKSSIYFTGDEKTFHSLLKSFKPKNTQKKVKGFSFNTPDGVGKIVGASYSGNQSFLDLSFINLTHYANLILPKDRISKYREKSDFVIRELEKMDRLINYKK